VKGLGTQADLLWQAASFVVCGQDLRADSMAAMTVGSSGRTSGEKRAATLPLRSMRNFSKFQRIQGSGLVVELCLLWRKALSLSRNAGAGFSDGFGLGGENDSKPPGTALPPQVTGIYACALNQPPKPDEV
jgi:hypothetical protein